MPKRKANAGGGSEAAGEEDASQAVLDDVLRVVRDCMVKLKAGDLFVETNLGKECYDELTPATTTDEDGNEKMTKVFKAFLGAVADKLAEETTMDSGNDAKMVKKMRKKWNKLLKENFEAVEEEVTKAIKSQADDPDQDQDMADADDDAGSTAAAATSGKDNEDNDLTSEHEFDDDDDDDDGDESGAESRGSSKRSKSSKSSKSSSKKKSKKAKRKAKKKKREKKKKRKAREMADLDASDAEDGDEGRGGSALNGMSREEAREMFVRERDETLSQIPKDVKERFRECGFATWGKIVYPIIELGPYDVPPGDLRDQWFAMFENVSWLDLRFIVHPYSLIFRSIFFWFVRLLMLYPIPPPHLSYFILHPTAPPQSHESSSTVPKESAGDDSLDLLVWDGESRRGLFFLPGE